MISAVSSSGEPRSAARPRPRRFSLLMFQHLQTEFQISASAAGAWSVVQHGYTVTGRLGDGDVAGDDCIKNHFTKEIPNFRVDFAGKFEGRIVHREQDAPELEAAGMLLHHGAN